MSSASPSPKFQPNSETAPRSIHEILADQKRLELELGGVPTEQVLLMAAEILGEPAVRDAAERLAQLVVALPAADPQRLQLTGFLQIQQTVPQMIRQRLNTPKV